MTRCPYRHGSHSAFAAIAAHADLERGVLPVAGGALDQSQPWREAMQLIGAEFARHREAEMQEARDGFN